MNTIGLIQIHEVLNSNDGECCYICFRPVSETKLVDPVFLDNLINKLANVTFFTLHNSTRVCYVCEALARSALRFIKAVELAAKVSELFSDLGPSQWPDIEKHLVPKTWKAKSTQVPDVVARRALRLERTLRRAARFTLQRTDTLVVAGPAPAPAPAPDPAHTAQLGPDMVLVMPEQLPMAPLSVPLMTPLVLPTQSQPQPQLSIHSDQNHLRVLNQETNEFILHPMVRGRDGKIYVPSLHVQIQDNGTMKYVSGSILKKRLLSGTNLNVVNSAPNVSNTVSNVMVNSPPNIINSSFNNVVNSATNVTNRSIQNVVNIALNVRDRITEPPKNDYSVPMQRAGVNNMEVIKMNELNIVLSDDNAKKRKLDELDQTLSEVTRLLSENNQGSCEIKYEIIEDDDEPSIATGTMGASNDLGNIRVISGNAGEMPRVNGNAGEKSRVSGKAGSAMGSSNAVGSFRGSNAAINTIKQPVLSTDRTVDWEDKIPMDVISFMDATDPNPQERIMQPILYRSPEMNTSMGVISDVRSVPDVPGTRDIECIDLC